MDILIPFFSALSMYLMMVMLIFTVETVGKDCRKLMFRMLRINKKRILSKSFKISVIVFIVFLLFSLGLKYSVIYFCGDECAIPNREPRIMVYFLTWCVFICILFIYILLMVKFAVISHKKKDLQNAALQ